MSFYDTCEQIMEEQAEREISHMDAWPTPHQLIEHFALRAAKKFGQNFLLDQHITDRIAQSAGDLTHSHVIEIGPGPCGLTMSLLRNHPRRVTVIEIDEHIFPLLDYVKTFAGDTLEIIRGDALNIDIHQIGEAPRKIVANLPYHVSTVLLFQWLRHAHAFESFTLMFQKEVAQRIVAQPGSSHYGRLSIMVQWLCHGTKVFDLPPGAFSPPPKVTSTVIHLQPRAKPLYEAEYDKLEKIVAAAFNQRRKMLRVALKGILGPQCHEKITHVGIDPQMRAEQLTIEEFCRMSHLL